MKCARKSLCGQQMTEEWRHSVSFRFKAVLMGRRGSAELNTLVRDGWSESTTCDIMKLAEFGRRDDGTTRFTVAQTGTHDDFQGGVLVKRRETLPNQETTGAVVIKEKRCMKGISAMQGV